MTRFMLASRLHLGLIGSSTALQPPRQVSGPLRRTLQSFVVAGLLGGLFSALPPVPSASRLPGEADGPAWSGRSDPADDHRFDAFLTRLQAHRYSTDNQPDER